MQYTIIAAVLGTGLVAGIFFAFSAFIMQALGRLPGGRGIAAMQAINITVLNPWFFTAFFGTALLCIGAVFLALRQPIGVENTLIVIGSGVYLFGCILVTVVFNVPLNNRLAALDADSVDAESVWAHYLRRWTLWNHIRTLASLVAALLFALAL